MCASPIFPSRSCFMLAVLLISQPAIALGQNNYYSMYWDGTNDFNNMWDDADGYWYGSEGDMMDIFQAITDQDYDQARFVYYQRMITNYCTDIGNFWSRVGSVCGEDVGIRQGADYLMGLDPCDMQYLDPMVAGQHAWDRLGKLEELAEYCEQSHTSLLLLQNFEVQSGIGISGGVYPTYVALGNNLNRWEQVLDTIDDLEDWMGD